MSKLQCQVVSNEESLSLYSYCSVTVLLFLLRSNSHDIFNSNCSVVRIKSCNVRHVHTWLLAVDSTVRLSTLNHATSSLVYHDAH